MPDTCDMRARGTTARGTGLHFGFLVFLGACLMMLPESLPINSASIFFEPVTGEFGISRSTFSLHTTIISLSIFASMTPMGALFRKLDLRLVMCLVTLLEAGCFLAYSLARSVAVFYVASMFIGAGQAVLVNLVVPVLVNNWFAKRTGLLIGIGTCMQGVGGAIFSALGASVIQAHGWRTCYVMFAAVVLVIGIPVSLFMLRRDPGDLGLLPVWAQKGQAGGASAETLAGNAARDPGGPGGSRNPRSADEAAPSGLGAAAASTAGTTAAPGITARTALATPCFYLLVIESACLAVSVIFNYYISPYVINLGADVATAGLASASVMVGMCAGKVGVGALCDRSAAGGVALGCGAGIAACLGLASMGGPSMGVICLLCFLFGIAYASASLLGAVLARHIFGPRDYDRIWPKVAMFIALGNAAGSFLWGVATDRLGFSASLMLVALVMAVGLVAGIACERLGRPLRQGWAAGE